MKNSFKMNFSPLIIALIVLCIIVSLCGTVINVYSAITLNLITTFRLITYIVLAILSFLLFALCFSLLFFAKYTIENDNISVRFGIIRFLLPIKDILSINFFYKTKQLAVVFKDGKYSYIMLKDKDIDGFIKAVRDKNSSIYYQEEESEKKS